MLPARHFDKRNGKTLWPRYSRGVKAIITRGSADLAISATATSLLDDQGPVNAVCEILLKYVRREDELTKSKYIPVTWNGRARCQDQLA
jgi:hypothetical protein